MLRKPASSSPELESSTSKRDVDYIAEAIAISRQSTHKRIKIGCIITTSRGEYLSSGFNKAKSHPVQAKYNNKTNRLAPQQFIHAEIDAVTKLPKSRGYTDLVAYIGRLDCSGNQAMCKPCVACTRALKDSGVTIVCYTNENGKVVKHGL